MVESVAVRLARLEDRVSGVCERVGRLEALPGRIDKVERARGEERATRVAKARTLAEDERKHSRRERQLYALGGLALTAINVAWSLRAVHG